MPLHIWTVTINDDNGLPDPQVYTTAAEAEGAARDWVRAAWRRWLGPDGDPCPDDWREAHQWLADQAGFMDSISLTEHDISAHPALEGMTAKPSPDAICVWYDAADILDSGNISVSEDDMTDASAEEPAHAAIVGAWFKHCGRTEQDALADTFWGRIPRDLMAMQGEISGALLSDHGDYKMALRLEKLGYVVGVRDPRINTDFPGAFMVAERYTEDMLPTKDGRNLWAIVGDDLSSLVREAHEIHTTKA